MALTRVSRHIIDEPLELQNINATGIGTFASLRVTGDLQVDGTTTTLDTVVTEVDRLEVSANNSTVGAAITQTGSGDILNLYDGGTEVFSVTDGGKVKIGTETEGQANADNLTIADSGNSGITIRSGNTSGGAIYFSDGTSGAAEYDGYFEYSHNSRYMRFGAGGGTERLRIDSDGRLLLRSGTTASTDRVSGFHNALQVEGTSASSSSVAIIRNSNDQNAAYLNFGKSRGTSLGSNTAVSANDTLAIISFTGSDGSGNFNSHASIRATVDGATGNGDSPGRISFWTTPDGSSSSTERLSITSDGKVRVPDNGKFVAGDGDDLQIYNNGTHSYIDNVTNGALILRNTSNGVDVVIESDDGSGGLANYFRADGSTGDAILYHYGAQRLHTTSTGINVVGTITADGLDIDDSQKVLLGTGDDLEIFHNGGQVNESFVDNKTGNLNIRNFADDKDIVIKSDNGSGGLANYIVCDGSEGSVILSHLGNTRIQTTNTGASVTGNFNVSGHIYLNDNREVVIGAGNDLKIYHDGSINRIRSDVLTVIEKNDSEDMASFMPDGAVVLFHNGSQKFETTTTGAKVTGALEVTQEYPTIRPTLDLNFAATKTLDRRITFSRRGVATYTDELGIVRYAPTNEPRFDHNFGTGESLGLLIEESRTNQFQYSTDFSHGYWTKTRTSITSNTTTSPDGTNTASTLTVTTGSNYAYLPRAIGTTNGVTYSLSYWVKYNNCRYVWLLGAEVPDRFAYFDLLNGVVAAANGYDCSITPYSNGWYRITATRTKTGSTATEEIAIGITRSSTSPTDNQVGDAVYVWGAQFETGDCPTSYIPTSGLEATREADFATIKGTNFTDFYNQTEGTLFGEFTIKDVGTSSAAIVNINQEPGSSYANSIMFVEIGTAAGYFGRTFKNSSGQGLSNGSSVANLLHPSTTPQTVSFGYTSVSGGELRVYWNGDYVNSSNVTSYVPTTLTNMRIGRGWGGTDTINAHIRKLSYYPKRLPDAQLQGLTQQ